MMAARELDPLSLELGSLGAKLDTVLKTQGEDREASAKYRTDVRSKLETHSNQLVKIDSATSTLNGRIAELEEKVDKLEESAAMRRGAVGLAGVLVKAAHIVSAAIGGVVAIMLSRWLSK